MRITKAAAEVAAKKIGEPTQKKIDKLKKELKNHVYLVCKSYVPKDVLTCFAKHSDFFKTERDIWINDIKTVYFEPSLPDMNFEQAITSNEKSIIIKRFREIEALEEQLKVNTTEIEQTLIGLSTYKRVQDQLPEAMPFLPVAIMSSPNRSLMINTASIKKLIADNKKIA